MTDLRLNIGCGRDYRPGWVNIDVSEGVKAEAYLDIRTDMLAADSNDTPIDDNSVEEIYCSGVLEQIGENEALIHAMNEMHRVLKPGGFLTVVVPNARYAIAHQDPMDVRKFTPETFAYFLHGDRHHKLYGFVYGFKGWALIHIAENDRHILTINMRK